MVATQRFRGTVTFFNQSGGTIEMPDGREAIVHYSAIRGEGVRKLQKGAIVSFLLEERRRGLYAVCVQEE